MNPASIQIDAQWKAQLNAEFKKEYFDRLVQFLSQAKKQGKTIYPPGPLIFNAFNLTPFDAVKVVIIGQDPYHNPNEAMGLSFSVPKNIKIPPSLKNIYKELVADLNISMPEHGDLSSWARQGVFLLNAMLTVEHKSPGSHKNIGWQTFTDAVIATLSESRENLVFLLWGRFAQSKRQLIDEMKHYVLEAAHPSPLARNAFSGCKHFSKTNQLLSDNNLMPINWQID
jgi:uracil-DNA glycosylase